MDVGWISSLCACACTIREWAGIYQARYWLRGFCIANLTSEINCHFKKVFDKFDSQNKLVQKR